jgi:hypothetical protein
LELQTTDSRLPEERVYSGRARQIVAALIVVLVVIAVWAVIEYRQKPPPPPNKVGEYAR